MNSRYARWFVLAALISATLIPGYRTFAKGIEGVRHEVSRSGQELLILTGHQSDVYTAIFSPDGSYILSGSRDGTARLWDARNGKMLQIFGDGLTPIEVVGFLPDGLHIFTSPLSGQMRLWNMHTGVETGQAGYVHCIRSASLANDHKCMLVAHYGQNTQFIDLTTGNVIQRLGNASRDAAVVALSPDNRYAVTCGGDGAVHLWNMQNGQRLYVFASPTSAIASVTFSPAGQYVVTGSRNGTLQFWDVRTGRELQRFAADMGIIHSVTFSPDGRLLLTGSGDGTVRVWSVSVLI